MELITIKTFDNLSEAYIIKSKLDSEDILCFLFDENIVALNPLFNVTVGGIKLKVKQSDRDKAAALIEESASAALTNDAGDTITCPNCGSEELYYGFKSIKGTKGLLAAIVSFLLMVFPIYYKTVNKCKKCGNEF